MNLRGGHGVQCVSFGCGVADLNSAPPAKREERKRSRGWQLAGGRAGGAQREQREGRAAVIYIFKAGAAGPRGPLRRWEQRQQQQLGSGGVHTCVRV